MLNLQYMTGDSDGADGPTLSIKEYLEENHRLFTVIGVFAALSVYFVELAGTNDEVVQIGVAASLILFLTATAVGVIETERMAKMARTRGSFKSTIRIVPYSVILYGLFFLGVSVLYLIIEKYPQGARGLVTTSAFYSTGFFYWAAIYHYADYSVQDRGWIIEKMYRYIPFFALVFPGASAYHGYTSGLIQNPIDSPGGYDFGVLTGAIIVHFIAVMLLWGVFEIATELYARFSE